MDITMPDKESTFLAFGLESMSYTQLTLVQLRNLWASKALYGNLLITATFTTAQ